MLVGFAAFLDLYSTQPLLPMLAHTFRASNFAVSLTVTAPTVAVALMAPYVGRLADRLGLRNVIVGSAFALAAATLLAGTASTLRQLIAWRFVQGAVTPGLFASAVAYIHEEWPVSRTGRVTAGADQRHGHRRRHRPAAWRRRRERRRLVVVIRGARGHRLRGGGLVVAVAPARTSSAQRVAFDRRIVGPPFPSAAARHLRCRLLHALHAARHVHLCPVPARGAAAVLLIHGRRSGCCF